MTASVTVPVGTTPGNYPVTIQATTSGTPTLTTAFTLTVTANPDFVLTEPTAFPVVNVGSTGTNGPIAVASQDGFTGTVTLSCAATFGAGSCSISPTSLSSYPATATLTINGTSFTAGSYSLSITGTSGSVVHSIPVPFNVGDYSVAGTQTLSVAPGRQGTANLTLTSLSSYGGKINATCDASALSGATCTLSPANPLSVASGGTANLAAILNVPDNAATGRYNIKINTQDTTGAPSHAFTVVLTVAQDFLVTSSTLSHTVTAGQTTGAYNLTIQPVGTSFDAAITLSCSGLPSLAQCLFNPAGAITPASSAINVVMTISTTATTTASRSHASRASIFYAFWLLLPGIVVGGAAIGRNTGRRQFLVLGAIMLLWLLTLPSCGGVSSAGGGGGHLGTPPGTYPITVTGSSSGTPAEAGQSTQVTLVVQ
jgi:hypothetical protein